MAEGTARRIGVLLGAFAMVVSCLPPGGTAGAQQPAPADAAVRLTEAADDSAGGLPCYRIETPRAVYYLDKVGAGLSSLVDRDGNDWIGFHPEPGSGAGGEYRGFPNAVFKEDGSYFHPRNAGTDPCRTAVEHAGPDRVVISAVSDNGLWAGRYEFTAEACFFRLTHMPAGRKYWVLYEGTPGGQYDDSDWWMTSGDAEKRPLTTNHERDLAGPEWIAFGDRKLQRVLVVSHLEDDTHTDRFYQMQRKMTVFGFGRDGMRKLLDSVPQTFAILLVETTDHAAVAETVEDLHTRRGPIWSCGPRGYPRDLLCALGALRVSTLLP